MRAPVPIIENAPLAAHTTLAVGGPARYLAAVATESELPAALAWATEHDLEVLILGGGSNILVADAGFDGLVLQLATETVRVDASTEEALTLFAAAGVRWDALVEQAVGERWAGIECLSGIPGSVGAAPMQNIGAYGQELADALSRVHILERETGELRSVDAADCGLGYRDSVFKRSRRNRYVVTGIELTLVPDGAASLHSPALRQQVDADASLQQVRDTVLAMRRDKSMVYDPADVNHRSAGSFFLNPIVATEEAERVAGVLGDELPRYPMAEGRVKLPAAWLIERCGFTRGWGDGPAGLSTNHTLAIVNRGEASAADIVQVAATVRQGVQRRTGITLTPEPVFVGFDAPVDALLG